jgi:hypothetical protein
VKAISRRAFLRGAGGVAIALPFLSAMTEKEARALPFPKRFVVFFTGLGTVKNAWVPSGTETDFTLGKILSPLAPFKKDLLVLEGIDMESAYHGPGDPHQLGIGQALTGTELQEGGLFKYACNANATVGWGGGISIDQLLAQQLGKATKFSSLELGVQVQNSNVSSRMSYQGPGKPVPPDDDPHNAFQRIFGDLGADPQSLAKVRAERHRVLDAVMDDYASLNQKLGADDKVKLEAHLEAIHDIDQRLDKTGTLGGACSIPSIGEPLAVYANDNYPQIGKLQLDLLAMSLACDLTRVASIQWTSVQTGKVFTWLGQTTPHHTLSHSGDSDAVSQGQLVDIGHWHAQQLAYLCGKLASIPEGDGTVLDNTVILWCTDIARGNTHARRDMPYVLVGGCGGALQTGRHVKYEGNHHNDLLVTLANAMDVGITTFGNPEYCTGPLPKLLA